MGDLKLPGVGSGFPIQSFVDLTVQAERAPKEQQFNRRASDISVQLSAYGSITGVLDGFKDALAKLGTEDAFQKRSASLSESGFVTAKADKNAVAGSYTLVVEQLAQAHKLSSQALDKDAKLGSGSVTLKMGEESFSVDIAKDKSSLAEVAQAINSAEDNKGVRATVVTDDEGSRLVFFAEKTGTDHQITVTATGTGDGDAGASLSKLGEGQTTVQAASDARLTIDGATVTSQSNEIKDAIAGVTLNLDKVNNTGADSEQPNTTLTIGYDKEAVETNLKSFVEAFNKVITTVNNLTAYDAETEEAGPLNGDGSARNLSSQIRRMLSETVEGAVAPITNLTDLGVTTQEDGSIKLDTEILEKQVSENFEKVGALFSGSGNNSDGDSNKGIAGKLNTLIDDFVGKQGVLTQKGESLSEQMQKLDTEKENFETYMSSFEERVYKQFSAMDIVVAQMNQQLSSVISAFENMPDFSGKK